MGKRAGWIRAGLLLVCFLLLRPGVARAEETAEDLTGRCVFTFTGSAKKQEGLLTDGRTANSSRLEAKDRLTVRAPSDMGSLVLRLSKTESAFVLVEQDAWGLPLRVRTLRTDALSLTFSLKPGCRAIQLFPLADHLRIAEAAVFGPGTVPDRVPHPAPAPDKVDFLLVSTHPDDEWVFLGGVYPLYGGERGLAGAVVYMTLPSWERAHESINGLWLGGVGTHPFFLGFPDIDQSSPRRLRERCKQEDVTLALVRLYRQIRPLVVVTQDPENGEYGHWQHKLSAQAAFDAVALAADPAFDPDSAARQGTWTVQKVYQHFAQGMSQVELDVDTPLSHYGGRTALEVAKAAFQAHRTQFRTPFRPGNPQANRGDIVHFGLTYSAVGPDTGNDLFEHIPKELLAANLPEPTPEPTAAPKDVSEGTEETPPGSAPEGAEPRATPSPVPTATPTLSPAPTNTSTPTPKDVSEGTEETPPGSAPEGDEPRAAPSLWDEAEEGARWASDRAAVIAGIVVSVLAVAVVGRQLKRAHHGKKKEG